MEKKLVLNNIQFNKGSHKPKKRVGRGDQTAGRGQKGQKARSGVSLSNFQGGQTPLERRLPKQKSFYTPEKKIAIKLESIDYLVDINLLEENSIIDYSLLQKIGYVKRNKKYKLIGKTIYALKIEAHGISEGAKESIEMNKGSFTKLE
jgi:large subunit ribosomal protein L15